MKPVTVSLLAGFVLVLTACGSTAKRDEMPPDWIAGESARYPATQYLLGRASAARPDEAEDRARADLAKTFEVGIRSESQDVQSFSRETGAGVQTKESGELAVSRTLQIRTEAVVRGIEIGDLWHDPKGGEYHALAVLSRTKVSQSLRDDIQRLDRATEHSIAQSREGADLFARIAAANRAVTAQTERAGYQRMLQVADHTGRGIEAPWNLGTLQADLDGLIARLAIAPRARGAETERLQNVVRDALAGSGFLVKPDREANYVLEATLELIDLGRRDGWYWLRGNLEIRVSDPAGRPRGAHRWSIKSSALQRDEAASRAYDQIAAVLKAELRATLIGMAE